MSERRVLLDCAAFLDSNRARAIVGASRAEIREVLRRFLGACYRDQGQAPRLLEGDDLARVLVELLPARYGVRDPLAEQTEEVLRAYLDFLNETQVVPASFEQLRALDQSAAAFREAVATGVAHSEGLRVADKGKTLVHRAQKVGRNDPCPCGSGRKFKSCCLRLGGPPGG